MSEPRSAFLTFFIGEDEYAVPLGRVSNALAFENVTRLPTAPRFVRGVLSVDGAAVPVLDLAARFGADSDAGVDYPSVVAVRVHVDDRAAVIGLLVSRLGRVLSIALRELQEPGLVTTLVPAEFLAGLLPVDDRFMVFLDVDRLLDLDEYRKVADLSEATGAVVAPERQQHVAHLVVRLGRERCALELARLREALACGPITRIPGAPEHVLGATNVRGDIVTVLDLSRRYGIGAVSDESERLLILADGAGDADEGRVGFMADAIDGLAQIPAESVARTPPFGTRFPTEVVVGMARWGGGAIPILDCEDVLKTPDSSVQGRVSEAGTTPETRTAAPPRGVSSHRVVGARETGHQGQPKT